MKHAVKFGQYPGWIRDRLRTGDCIAFRGYDFWPSGFICAMTWSKYSHVAKVLNTKEDRVYLMESTTTDTGKGKKVSGVQRTLLSERCAGYNGYIDVLFLSETERQKYDIKKAEEFALSMEGRPYDAWGAGISGIGQITRIPGRARYGSLMCSEFADAMDCAAGLIVGKDRTPTPKEYTNREIWQFDRYRIVGAL